MKRCPNCDRSYPDDVLRFCLTDGTPLVTEAPEPRPTFLPPPPGGQMPPSPSSYEWSQPATWSPPPLAPPASIWPGDLPPLPGPTFIPPSTQEKGMAIASLISAASGLMCCTFGGPVGLGLGIGALVQIRKDPARYGGKEMAIAGIILGSLPILLFVLYIVFILIGTTLD